jgi:hypothetical protein
MRIPDELGQASDRAIIAALGMEEVSVKGVRIDFNDNECAVELYVLDWQGRKVLDSSGEPLTTWVEFPVYKPRTATPPPSLSGAGTLLCDAPG